MKTALKAVLWSLIGISVGVLLFTCVAASLSTSENAETAALWNNIFDIAINIDLIWSYVLLAIAVFITELQYSSAMSISHSLSCTQISGDNVFGVSVDR